MVGPNDDPGFTENVEWAESLTDGGGDSVDEVISGELRRRMAGVTADRLVTVKDIESFNEEAVAVAAIGIVGEDSLIDCMTTHS